MCQPERPAGWTMRCWNLPAGSRPLCLPTACPFIGWLEMLRSSPHVALLVLPLSAAPGFSVDLRGADGSLLTTSHPHTQLHDKPLPQLEHDSLSPMGIAVKITLKSKWMKECCNQICKTDLPRSWGALTGSSRFRQGSKVENWG